MIRIPALLVTLSLLLAAGCGDDDGGGSNSSDLAARAVQATQSADSYRMTLEMDSDLGGEKLFMEGEGVSAADQSRGRYEVDMAIGEQEPQPVEMLNVDGVMYMRGGMFDEVLPDGKEWLRVPDDTPATMTPSEFVEFLLGTDEVEQVGTEQVRGRRAIHLRGPLDMKKLIENTDSAAARQFSEMPQVEEIEATIDVWVDEADERVSRMALEMSHPDAPGTMNIRADMLEYDVSLKGIEPPPAAKVADGGELGG